VSLDAANARAGFPFATSAMRGPNVLDTGDHPEIRFKSLQVSGQGTQAQVEGELTIRGVTQPAVFQVELFRAANSTDASRLAILMKGSVDRTAFGATGWPDMVRNRIDIKILAEIIPES